MQASYQAPHSSSKNTNLASVRKAGTRSYTARGYLVAVIRLAPMGERALARRLRCAWRRAKRAKTGLWRLRTIAVMTTWPLLWCFWETQR